MLNVPLASTIPSRSSATANGLPGIPSSIPDLGVVGLLEGLDRDERVAREHLDRRLERVADVTALGDEHGERQLASGSRSKRATSAVREPRGGPSLGDLERPLRAEAQAQHPDLSRERQHGDAEAGAGEQRRDQPEAEPLVGRELVGGQEGQRGERGGEDERFAPTAVQPTVERAPKQAQGAPARPRMIAPTIVAANIAISAAASHAAVSEPAITPIASPSSVAIRSAQGERLGAAAVDAEGRQRGPARSRARELRETGACQHPAEDESRRHLEHARKLARGIGPRAPLGLQNARRRRASRPLI